MNKKTELHWSYSTRREEKSGDWYFALWVLALAVSAVLFLISNLISALLVLSAALAISAYAKEQSGKNKTYKCALTLKGLKINDRLYPYDSIERFNITENKGKKYLLLEVKSVITPELLLEIDDENLDDIYFYISQFVEEDPKYRLDIKHAIAEKLGL